MEQKTLSQKLGEYFLTGYLAVSMTVIPYCLGRMIYDRVTADRTKTHCETTLHGFDDNNDGAIDRIVEYGIIAGARMAAPMRRTFTSDDKEFEQLARVLDQ
jgi:hypothetical protein